MVKVCQAVNTTNYDTINGDSCINYWNNNAPNDRQAILMCRATSGNDSEDDPIVGGHVIGINNHYPHVYIVPILRSVNTSGNPRIFSVEEEDLVQVPTNQENAILADRENQNLARILASMR